MREKKFHTMVNTSEGEADYDFSKWVGTLFFYLINGGAKSFDYYTQKKFGRRNLWTGYFIKLGVFALIFYILIRLFS